MKKHLKKILVMAAVLSALVLGGCSSTPDTVEDPLSAFGIDAVLPFETLAPEVNQPTPSPAPTPDIDNLPTDSNYGQSWKADDTVNSDNWLDEDEDDVVSPQPTPRPVVNQPSEPDYTRLSSGDSGSEVRQLQTRLKKLGYYTGTVDGQFGSGTVSAVKRFQSIMGYNQTGVATAELQELIYDSSAPKYVAPTTPAPTPQYVKLSKGDTGTQVKRLQNRLKTLGYYTGTADGTYGTATVNAVKRFQDAVGLDRTGTATAALQKKLFSPSAPYYEDDEPDPTPEPEEEGYVRLAKGSSGARVRQLQSRLKSLGYYSGSVDGQYGSGTVSAIKRFQQAVGVNQTGVATASLQKKIYSPNAPVYEGEIEPEEDYTTLEPGDSGAQVKTLQRRLKELGYFDGDVGGNYLTKTTTAVKLFQKTIGVKQTGIATASLQKKLFSSDAPVYRPNVTPEPEEAEYVRLQRGDSSERVRRLQQRLTDLGYYTSSINGNFGDKTAEAVKRFEARYGKEKTGIATVALQKKLFSSDALPYKASETPVPDEPEAEYIRLEKGATGTRVKKLQRRLKELGYFEGAIGGNYQKLTTDAVKRFQAAIGVKQNGVATVALQEVLFSDDAPVYEKVTSDTEPAITYKKLKRNDTGTAVSQLQERLVELGYLHSVDEVKLGTFDKNTMLAVIDAQNARGYDSDGVADVDFQTYIYSDSAWDYTAANYEGG